MAYDYIARTYGTRFTPGMRVTFDEYGDAPGTVKRVTGDPHHVRVKFDDGREGNCHPSSLKISPRHGTCNDVERVLRVLAAEGKIIVHDADECVSRIYRAAHGLES